MHKYRIALALFK